MDLGLNILRLPLGAASNEANVPIFVSKDISTKKRVMVLFGERMQDLGVFSYRTVGDQGINVGSAVEFCSAVLQGPTMTSDQDAPGIILTNPGQLLWYRGGGRAITCAEWVNLPRDSSIHEPLRVDQIKNTIPGNRNYVEHVRYVFEHIMTGVCGEDTTFDIIGLGYTGQAALKYLANHCERQTFLFETSADQISQGTPGPLVLLASVLDPLNTTFKILCQTTLISKPLQSL